MSADNEVSFWDGENFLQLDYGYSCTTLNKLKTTELHEQAKLMMEYKV